MLIIGVCLCVNDGGDVLMMGCGYVVMMGV